MSHEYIFRRLYIQELWQRLGAQYKSVAIYAAGQHTDWLLATIADLTAGPTVAVIFDDCRKGALNGIQIATPCRHAEYDFDAVVISSDTQEQQLAEQAEAALGDSVPVVQPYAAAGTGPFRCEPDASPTSSAKNDVAIDELLAANNLPTRTRCQTKPTVGFATVEQFNRYADLFPELCLLSGDTKNVQRGWIAETIMRHFPAGSRILEVGGDSCLVADYLQRRGYEVWNVDPYACIDGGTAKYEEVCKRFPDLKICRGFLHEAELPADYFDCVYSISVLEHVACADMADNLETAFAALKPDGLCIHAVDYTVSGPQGFMENHECIETILDLHQVETDIAGFRYAALADINTLYLSPDAHYRWRQHRGDTYAAYPYRRAAVICLCAPVPAAIDETSVITFDNQATAI